MFIIRCALLILLSFLSVEPQYLHYVGCFEDNSAKRIFSTVRRFPPLLYGNNHPETCSAYCRKQKYAFAGLENQYDCWCGNSYPTKKVPNKKCNLLCLYANALTCGGVNTASVYRTGISQSGRKIYLVQTRPDLEYIGCFNHSSERLSSIWEEPEVEVKLGWAKSNLKMTPARCTRTCSNSGFVLSGVAKGNECQCSQDVHETAERLDESNCMVPCEGNEYMRCGGMESHIISVYNKTGPQI